MLQFKVLIAEDEPPVARYIRTLVEEAGGYTVVGLCEDGEEALVEEIVTPANMTSGMELPLVMGFPMYDRVRTDPAGQNGISPAAVCDHKRV